MHYRPMCIEYNEKKCIKVSYITKKFIIYIEHICVAIISYINIIYDIYMMINVIKIKQI